MHRPFFFFGRNWPIVTAAAGFSVKSGIDYLSDNCIWAMDGYYPSRRRHDGVSQ